MHWKKCTVQQYLSMEMCFIKNLLSSYFFVSLDVTKTVDSPQGYNLWMKVRFKVICRGHITAQYSIQFQILEIKKKSHLALQNLK